MSDSQITPEQVSAMTDGEEIDGLVHQRDEAREQLATYKDLYSSAVTLLGDTRRERDQAQAELVRVKAERDEYRERSDVLLAEATADLRAELAEAREELHAAGQPTRQVEGGGMSLEHVFND